MANITTQPASAPLSFAGSELGDIPHVCAFFSSEEDEYRVLLPFIKDGFERGERAIHVLDPAHQADHLQRLAAAGIDAAAAQQRGQFELRSSVDTYLRDGCFDQDRMLHAFEQLSHAGVESGFTRSRIVCRMQWAAADRSYLPDLVEFEARVNELWRRRSDAVVCVYDLASFRGDAVVDLMRSHPLIIVGGILHHNPFFVPPEEFAVELRRRRSHYAV